MGVSKTTWTLMLGASLALLAIVGPGARVLAAQSGPSAQSGVSKPSETRSQGNGGREGAAPGAQVEWEWWADPRAKADLKLSDEQAKKIQAIYDKWRAEYAGLRDTLVKQRESLDRMTTERVATASDYQTQVRDVERSRSMLAESRTVMLYRVYLELNPGQYQKLKQIRDSHFSRDDRGPSNRGGGPGSGR